MTKRPRRPPRFGPEVWEERFGQEWSLWDLWFCVVIELDHNGASAGLRDVLIGMIRAPRLGSGREGEAKLSHLDDVVVRLGAAGVQPSDLAGPDELGDKALVSRAQDKVVGKVSLEWRAKTPAMLHTPRVLYEQRSRFGWDAFRSDPTRFFERFRLIADGKGHVDKYQSFDVTGRLVRRLEELDGPRRTLVDRVSLYRAFHTAGLVLADRSDDSHGNLGEARRTAWNTYLSLDWRRAGIEPEAYWRDICELLIWEPYAIDHQEERTWFVQVHTDEVDLVAAILSDSETDLRASILDWEADRALEAVAHLFLATDRHDRFPAAAERLGSRSWIPIVAMAEHALQAGDAAVAAAVFDAADQPGMHQEHLRRQRSVTLAPPLERHEC